MYRPLLSLREGSWFKLICGASYQHLPAVRNLALVYSLAGVDCVDIAADPAVVASVCEAFQVAEALKGELTEAYDSRGIALGTLNSALSSFSNERWGRPWLMISLNDGEDPHFRKAVFDPHQCPPDCSRPCEKVCPADAIVMPPLAPNSNAGLHSDWGVIAERCYGCGRCLPVCPIQNISARSHQVAAHEIAASLLPQVDAIEIHTQVGHEQEFQALWQAIAPHIHGLKLVAVSCPDGEDLIGYLRHLHTMMTPRPQVLIWQTDGRPMSGDIGKGTTHASIRLAQKVLDAHLPGYVQLAGGTNAYTVPKLQSLQLLQSHTALAGVAYGSYARTLLQPVFAELEVRSMANSGEANSSEANNGESDRLEHHPDLLHKAVKLAQNLVRPLKSDDSAHASKLNISKSAIPNSEYQTKSDRYTASSLSTQNLNASIRKPFPSSSFNSIQSVLLDTYNLS